VVLGQGRGGESKPTNRLKGLLKEGDKLDNTIKMTEEIIEMGNLSSVKMTA